MNQETLQKMFDSPTPTLVEIYASWCPHCHRMMPIVESLKEVYDGRVNILQYDGDAHPEIDRVFGVKSYPTWVMFKNGEEVWRDAGEKASSDLEAIFNRFM